MLHFLDPLRQLSVLSVLVRFALTILVGGVIGLERSVRNKPAGLRTHILVAIAAAASGIIGHYIYLYMRIPSDLSRIGSSVIAGMGFLGAGTIIKTPHNAIKGLTTAAGLWATVVAGLAIGSGFYEGGVIAGILILVIETSLAGLAPKIKLYPEVVLRISYENKPALDKAVRLINDMNISLVSLQIEHDDTDDGTCAMLHVRGPGLGHENLPVLLEDISGIVSVTIV